MARPTNKEYRAAILGAFDTHMHRTLKEVNEHLQSTQHYVNEQSTRRMLAKMVSEGLLLNLKRGDKNAIIYTKALFSPHIRLRTMQLEVVNVPEFVQHVDALNSKTFSKPTLEKIKQLLLDGLATAYEEPYISRGTTPVAKDEVRRELSALLNVLSTWHVFIKSYLDASIWDDFNRDNLAKEFKTRYPEIHAAIVERHGYSQKAS